MKVRLWVEAEGSDDMDLFIGIQKLDADGKSSLLVFSTPWRTARWRWAGCASSHRELDQERSRREQPWHTHQREQRLKPGQVVPVDIEIWPSGTRFLAGEQLRLVVQGNDIQQYPPGVVAMGHSVTRNRGTHVIHTGGRYDSHLLVPVIPLPPEQR